MSLFILGMLLLLFFWLPHSYLFFSSAIGISLVSLVFSSDLVLILFSLELINFSLYLLASGFLMSEISLVSAFKFLLVGALSSSLLLLSFVLYYGYSGLLSVMLFPQFSGPLLIFLTGVSLKLGLFPLHFWLSDVYEGSPFITWVATIPKASVLYVVSMFSSPIVVPIGLMSILVGSILMGSQLRIKRLVAFSSLAHLGYLMISTLDQAAFLMYLVFYMFSLVLLFDGLSKNQFSLVALVLFFMSGLPPSFGFIAKIGAMSLVLDLGLHSLVPFFVMCSCVSVAYYLKGVRLCMFYQANSSNMIHLNGNGTAVDGINSNGSYVCNISYSTGLLCAVMFLFMLNPGSLMALLISLFNWGGAGDD